MNPLVQSSKKKPVEKMGNCVELLCMSPVCVCVYIHGWCYKVIFKYKIFAA